MNETYEEGEAEFGCDPNFLIIIIKIISSTFTKNILFNTEEEGEDKFGLNRNSLLPSLFKVCNTKKFEWK